MLKERDCVILPKEYSLSFGTESIAGEVWLVVNGGASAVVKHHVKDARKTTRFASFKPEELILATPEKYPELFI